MKPTAIVDFDGVLHSYASGWKGADCIPDPPTHGAKEAMQKLRETHNVVVVSSRCAQGAKRAILLWLDYYGITVDDVTDVKPPHVVVIDDRALRFEGDWAKTLAAVPAASVPWNKKEASA